GRKCRCLAAARITLRSSGENPSRNRDLTFLATVAGSEKDINKRTQELSLAVTSLQDQHRFCSIRITSTRQNEKLLVLTVQALPKKRALTPGRSKEGVGKRRCCLPRLHE